MAIRTVVTSHPDVACELCGRRLLRGEQADIYLAGAHRRVVCELCAPRAAAEGWLREGQEPELPSASERPARPRGIFGLRPWRRPPTDAPEGQPAEGAEGPYGFMAGLGSSAAPGPAGQAGDGLLGPEQEAPPAPPAPEASPPEQGPQREELAAGEAVRAFNASEHPKRVAGIARALGAPIVTVRPAPESQHNDRFQLTLAWEICWSRYEVDLAEPDRAVLLAAEGLELEELPSEDLHANARADERGELALV